MEMSTWIPHQKYIHWLHDGLSSSGKFIQDTTRLHLYMCVYIPVSMPTPTRPTPKHPHSDIYLANQEPYTVCANRLSMKVSRNSRLSPISGASNDFPAVMGSLSGAGCERYIFDRVR